MAAADDLELRVVVAEGILDAAEARALAGTAADAGQGLLDHLREAGRISEPTFTQLRALIDGSDQPVDQSAPTMRASAHAATVRGGPSTPRLRVGPAHSDPGIIKAWSGQFVIDDPEAFPVPGWDRYEPLALLGEGGMGRVFLARDVKLDRKVAIKFVRGDDPELVRRITLEARAQARVRDDRVCQVFDVGEIEGKIFIAMQAIEGKTLAELSKELTFEQKAMVVRGAALGVAEAHRVGLIHRDLKPTNIMVERTADGDLRPFVMDFGIARDWADDHTATGTVLGTPQFMAPEQARGEVKQLDRRADIYSLGATLYSVLVDRPPITGDNPLVVINRIAFDEPPRPRTIDPDVPIDLEAIVMKCLEKERAARYDSARALADDLGRFLAGEPVAARGTLSLRHRLARTLRRRWRLAAVAGVVLSVVLVALGFGLRERWRAARREELARRFTERVERIDALARTSALAPAHDLRNDRALIVAEMDAIAAEMRAEGQVATASGHYALGRGHLVLGDDERAAEELQAARRAGARDPRATYALALALGNLYQRGLREVDLLPREERGRPRAALIARYREPALALLRTGGGASEAPRELVAALIAFNEDRHDDALRSLDAIDLAAGGMASFFEAPLLRGRVLEARAVALASQGQAERAAADLEAGRVALARAAAIAESDPFIQVEIAELEHVAFITELYGAGAIDGPYARGVEACGRALALLPDLPAALRMRARFRRTMAVHLARRGEDVSNLLTEALADAGRVVEVERDHAQVQRARYELAEAHRSWGEVLQSKHEDPGPKLEAALAVAAATAPDERDANDWVQLGLIHTHWADYLAEVGDGRTDHRDQAIAAYEQATTLDDRRAEAWLNLSKARFARAKAARGAEADRFVAGALDALARGTRLAPDNLAALAYEAEVHSLAADRAEARGLEPEPERAAAIAAYRRAIELNADEPVFHQGLGIELGKRARFAWDSGRDPDAALLEARAAAGRAVAVAPDDPTGHNNLGDLWWRQAVYDHERGRDPGPAVRAAHAAFDKALALLPNHPVLLSNTAAVDIVAASEAVARGGDPRPTLGRAEAKLDQAARSGAIPDEPRLRGAALAVLARWQAGREVAEATFEQAVSQYRKGLEASTQLGPELPEAQQIQLELAAVELSWAQARRRAAGDPSRPTADGRETVERVLQARPTWPRARALAAGLRLLEAAAMTAPAQARDAAARATAELAAALAADPNLTTRWAPVLSAARQPAD